MSRIAWLDCARGIGITLVVIGHALGGLIDSSLGEGQLLFRQVFFSIYTFHMPLFLLLSGLLIVPRLEKGNVAFVKGLVPTIVWPYFLWSTLQFTLIYMLGSLVNRPAETYWPVILSLPWNTVSQFWFLYALFWLHLLAVVLLPRLGREGFVLLALGLKALVLIISVPVAVKLVCTHAFFYAVGVWLGTGGIDTIVLRQPRWARLVFLPVLAGTIIVLSLLALPTIGADIPLASAASPEISNLAWRFPVMLAALLGVAATLGLASLITGGLGAGLAYLGRNTMPIFVLHVMFIAGLRIGLTRFAGVNDPAMLAAAVIIAGILGPLLAERITQRLGLNRVLGFGG